VSKYLQKSACSTKRLDRFGARRTWSEEWLLDTYLLKLLLIEPRRDGQVNIKMRHGGEIGPHVPVPCQNSLMAADQRFFAGYAALRYSLIRPLTDASALDSGGDIDGVAGLA
jgi:hypothetical protein